jgi:glycosyltransferase involved in cell wall biosynthesis
VPVKRLDLLLEGIAYAARFRPNQKFEWHHLGSGPMSAQLESTAKELKYANLKCFFHGHLPNEEVISFYREYPVDVFMNVSESEGIPVSIMEAQSCGIPVIASAVGGIPEIVWEKHGRLLSTNPTTSEIAEAIFEFLDNRTTAKQMRFFSRQVWRDRYNAEKNYQSFSQRLVSLVGKDVQA